MSTLHLQAILIATGYVFYNIFLHPLRGVPGPTLWAATEGPYAMAWLSGRAQFAVHDLHKRYGDVVRIGPNRLSFTDPDAWHEIRGHRKNSQGEHSKDKAFYSIAQGNILGADRANHARFRRILSHGFSAKAMQDQQPLITYYVDLLMQRLAEHTRDEVGNARDAVVNLGAWFNFTTFDVIGDLAFGEPFGCLEDSYYHPWVKTIFDGLEKMGVYMAASWYCPWLLTLTKKLLPRGYIGDKIDQQSRYTLAKLDKRLSLGASRPDFVESMITAKSEDGHVMSKEQLVLHGRILVLAGSETTATALSGAAYFLATNPDAQRKLAHEVRTTFSSVEEIDLFSVNKLRYMLAVLDESMRMFPPVPSQLPRVCRAGGDVICGYQVPEGVCIGQPSPRE
jgi:cytochrome P450